METSVSCEEQEVLIEQGEPVNRLYVLVKGSVIEERVGMQVTLGAGAIIGLADTMYERYDATYIADSACTVIRLSYRGIEDFKKIFEANPVYIFGFAKGALNQCNQVIKQYEEEMNMADELYENTGVFASRYVELAKGYGYAPVLPVNFENREPLVISYALKDWEKAYIRALYEIENKKIESVYGGNIDVVIGLIGTCTNLMERAVDALSEVYSFYDSNCGYLLNEQYADLFQSVFDLQIFAAQRELDQEPIKNLINDIYSFVTENNLMDELVCHTRLAKYEEHNFDQDAFDYARKQQSRLPENVFEHIMGFAGIDSEKAQTIKTHLDKYRGLEDRLSKEDGPRKLRKLLTDDFYEVYEAVFRRAYSSYELSPVLKLFLNFGIMDTEGFTDEQINSLLQLADVTSFNDGSGVYTIFGWLRMVYTGEREPSKNEMDLDFRGHLLEQRKNGEIREEDVERFMKDNDKKLKFEIENFFKSANRTCSGLLSAFCPVTFAEDFTMNPENLLVSSLRLKLAIKRIEDVDFGIFYRDVVFSDPEYGIRAEQVKKRVEPDIILLPTVGNRSMLWQETGGVKIDMPGRIVFPIFTNEDIDKHIVKILGSFRWEICKREQGTRWNDIHSNCLTSDFYDYFTFYKKNKELSAEQKEKIKQLLASSRGNTREAFSRIYTTWIIYEATGNMRLSKMEREFLTKHVPFSKMYRTALMGHPSFAESITRYNIFNGQKIHHVKMVLDKYIKVGGSNVEELQQTLDVLQM